MLEGPETLDEKAHCSMDDVHRLMDELEHRMAHVKALQQGLKKLVELQTQPPFPPPGLAFLYEKEHKVTAEIQSIQMPDLLRTLSALDTTIKDGFEGVRKEIAGLHSLMVVALIVFMLLPFLKYL